MTKTHKEIKAIPTLEEYLSWDIYIWNKALNFWREVLNSHKNEKGLALEVGSKDGGLSLFLSYDFGFKTFCTDIEEINSDASELHKKYGAENKISYSIADACSLNFSSDMFDVVILKSVLGSIGKNDNTNQVKKAIAEIYRVLKPGGILLYAENAKGSFIHTALRKIFRRWAVYWKYFSINEIESLLVNFSRMEIHTAGVISAFFSGTGTKKKVLPLDNILEKITPENSRYMIYGYAQK
ncbi:MAG: class I SAM-dependent methyltransferase [Bacteroidetes bacterium]|nr:class I SAM-dependent methyltransferase [Bacteroidota bacterium]